MLETEKGVFHLSAALPDSDLDDRCFHAEQSIPETYP